MKFPIKRRHFSNYEKYPKKDIELARKFAKKIYKEMGNFIVAVALFGSAARATQGGRPSHDVDILVIVDDIHVILTRDIVETYRIITAKAIADVDKNRLHVQTMNWSAFWEYVRAGDPVAINILRDSIALIDIGFFDPLQILLATGRIRPSAESIWTYYTMAPASLERANTHIKSAIIDLYWAAIDAAHAALMSLGEVPPSPEHVAAMIEEKMVKPKHVAHRYSEIMNHLYLAAKRIMHGSATSKFDGKLYERYRALTIEFVNTMKKFIEKQKIEY